MAVRLSMSLSAVPVVAAEDARHDYSDYGLQDA